MPHSPLPLPSPAALAHSQRLTAEIKTIIQQAGGVIPLADFMAKALYQPGLGYYSAGLRKFGAAGDFITAPEISPLFSQCIAQQCQQILTLLGGGVILEFGAGTGIMAVEILKELNQLNCLPTQYLILEVSADLRQRQQEILQAQIPDLLERVQWLEHLPILPLQGIILANEVLDALPVHRFYFEHSEILEFYVGIREKESENLVPSDILATEFTWQLLPTRQPTLQIIVEKLSADLPNGYSSEVNLALPAWLHSVANILAKGMILLIDYGFPQREYYHPQRTSGTLMCHYQHYAHDNPLILVGLQDITAHVNFTLVAETAIEVGLSVAGYTSQAQFLLACGLAEKLSQYDPNDTPNYLQVTQQIKTLTLPSEMGELFKVMALTRQIDEPLLGFVRDERGRL